MGDSYRQHSMMMKLNVGRLFPAPKSIMFAGSDCDRAGTVEREGTYGGAGPRTHDEIQFCPLFPGSAEHVVRRE